MSSEGSEVATERAFLGAVLHTPARGKLEMIRDALMVVGGDGRISAVHRSESANTRSLIQHFAATGNLVTLGPAGGIALDLPIGVFREGFQFDALVIDATVAGSNLHSGDHDTPDEVLQKIIYHCDRADIREVWVANRRVHAAAGVHGNRLLQN